MINYQESINSYIGPLKGTGARLSYDNQRNVILASVNSFCSNVGLPWEQIKHLYSGDINNPEYTDIKDIKDIDNPDIHRWVSTMVNPSNDSKYGRSMFCLKTGILRGLTMGEFYRNCNVID